ncbi:hypothetical protein ACWNT8_12930 [Pigmentibacter ruber]
MNSSKILLIASVIIPSAALYSCKDTASAEDVNAKKSSADNVTGLYSVNSTTCNGTSVGPYGAYGAYGAYGSSTGSNISWQFDFNQPEGQFIFNKKLSDTVTCKYSEKVEFTISAGNKITIVSKSAPSADPANDASCSVAPATSYLNSFFLDGEYNYSVSGNKVTLISNTDLFCTSLAATGNVTIDLSK